MELSILENVNERLKGFSARTARGIISGSELASDAKGENEQVTTPDPAKDFPRPRAAPSYGGSAFKLASLSNTHSHIRLQ